ncbi:hypothetical protein [Dictyobacter kobayashii]|uniref:Copper resistance protein D domain-containing protein n=1 Tax=Dictyobacter kobayashii TaxID=2014872 RepID=A0A402AKZ9_9CHLR|nr:hypothetical protein [Dictyobacter kobayashii]GCE19801.1 hypothetical protein KDK_36010 [Dictyobacter kobayashii]
MWLIYSIQWLHVLCGIFWLGSALYGNFVVIPAISSLPMKEQRKFAQPIGERGDKLVIPAAILVILFGLIRGIVFGPVQSLDFLFGTAYGLTFLVSFIMACATLIWGIFVMGRTIHHINNLPLENVQQADGTFSPTFLALVQRAKLIALLELVGFLIVFSCMILMRFGL